MITTAHMYNLTQTQLDEICNKIKVYPVPDYERFFTNLKGELYLIQLNDDQKAELIKQEPFKIKDNGVCKYRIADLNNNLKDITNVQLCALTFFGYFPEEYLYLRDGIFKDSSSIRYHVDNQVFYTEDYRLINGIPFKRIYYKGMYKTNSFISRKGVVYSDSVKRILAHQFQHNMYHRHQIIIPNMGQKRIGTNRLVYNTWANKKPWIPDEIQINHKDGFKYHNWIENLEETTQLENMRHSKLTGLRPMPYNEEFIVSLCILIQSNLYDIDEMQEILNIPKEDYVRFKSLVYSVSRGKSWTDISKDYDFTDYLNEKNSRKSLRLADEICKAYVESGYDLHTVSNQFPDTSYSHITSICRGESYPKIGAKYGLPLNSVKKAAMSKEEFRKAREYLHSGKSIEETADHFNTTVEIIKSLISRDNRLKK